MADISLMNRINDLERELTRSHIKFEIEKTLEEREKKIALITRYVIKEISQEIMDHMALEEELKGS